MIIWMNRIARHLKKEIEEKVESYASRAARPGLGSGPVRFSDGGEKERSWR